SSFLSFSVVCVCILTGSSKTSSLAIWKSLNLGQRSSSMLTEWITWLFKPFSSWTPPL
ncbi:unnamed protein product, partial [Brassica napus]